jgi:hypothetical protein
VLLAPILHVLKGRRGLQPLAATGSAEAPKFAGSTLIAVDDVIEVELVDLTGIELSEAVADVLEQNSELLLVVGANGRSRSRRLAFSLRASC